MDWPILSFDFTRGGVILSREKSYRNLLHLLFSLRYCKVTCAKILHDIFSLKQNNAASKKKLHFYYRKFTLKI